MKNSAKNGSSVCLIAINVSNADIAWQTAKIRITNFSPWQDVVGREVLE